VFFDLLRKDDGELIRTIIEGVRFRDSERWTLNPLPNLMFTRDIGFCIHNKIFAFNTSQPAREKERILIWYILKYHPFFRDVFVDVKWRRDETIEGGDVILLDDERIIVGISDRTRLSAIRHLAVEVFGNTDVREIIATQAPLQHVRSMHLDTFMGMVDEKVLLAYEHPLSDPDQTFYSIPRKGLGEDIVAKVGKFDDFLRLRGYGSEPIWVDDEKEQWEDGCNVLSVAPGRVIGYKRAKKTATSLTGRGWTLEFPRFCGQAVKRVHSVFRTQPGSGSPGLSVVAADCRTIRCSLQVLPCPPLGL